MIPSAFRRAALKLPDAVAGEHMGHADFRVGGKIFATMDHPERGWAMVKLTPAEQSALLLMHPDAFEPASGAWGEKGATMIKLKDASAEVVAEALESAWRGRAPTRLLDQSPKPTRKSTGPRKPL